MKFEYDDGGRAAAGFKGDAGDCVVRAIAIAARLPYTAVYHFTNEAAKSERPTGGNRKRSGARTGVYTSRAWFRRYMQSLGFEWTPTMAIGSGCKVHLHDGELPDGRLVVAVSKHYTAVVDGTIRDTHDPQRTTIFYEAAGNRIARRCVYGYWRMTDEATRALFGAASSEVFK